MVANLGIIHHKFYAITFSHTATKGSVRHTPASVNYCGVLQGECLTQCASNISILMAVNMVTVGTTGPPVSIYHASESKSLPVVQLHMLLLGFKVNRTRIFTVRYKLVDVIRN